MKHIALVLGTFHKEHTEAMRAAAISEAKNRGLNVATEVWVHGSLEKPLALKRLLQRREIDGAVVLGIIERGETKHGLVMGHVVLDKLLDLQLEFMKPVGIGILGPEILPDQIKPRLVPYAQEAVVALADMLEDGD